MAVAERQDVEEAEDTRERVTVWDTGEVLYVHPVASLFPMMSDEELDDLAADIRQNGQADPIVRDQHGQLIDGRNRLEACRRAEVSPDIIEVGLDDPVAFILSKNVARRQMDKGQIAMAVVEANFFSGKKVGFGEEQVLARQLGVSGSRLSYAVTIMKHARELSPQVLNGSLPLNEAYAAAVQSKRARKSAEEQARQHDVDMQRLRAGAADLAERVEEHRLDLDAALAELASREERTRQRRATVTQNVFEAVNALSPTGAGVADKARRLAEDLTPGRLPDGSALSRVRLEACAAVLTNLSSLLFGERTDEEGEDPDQS
jgi:ParB-like nuclease domain